MTVHVDSPRWRLGRMIMCHMMSDDLEELHAMAERIGVARRHFQGDHYDICKAKRALAVKHGAVESEPRTMIAIRRRLRDGT